MFSVDNGKRFEYVPRKRRDLHIQEVFFLAPTIPMFEEEYVGEVLVNKFRFKVPGLGKFNVEILQLELNDDWTYQDYRMYLTPMGKIRMETVIDNGRPYINRTTLPLSINASLDGSAELLDHTAVLQMAIKDGGLFESSVDYYDNEPDGRVSLRFNTWTDGNVEPTILLLPARLDVFENINFRLTRERAYQAWE